jgi:aminoglycoside/choline kinase family phosphotransferase
MIINRHIEVLKEMFGQWAHEQGIEVEQLPQAGGYRQYYRLIGHAKQAIGVYSQDTSETNAFLGFTKHFGQIGLHVPEIYASDPDLGCYLISDLGSTSLFDFLATELKNGEITEKIRNYYQQSISELIRFQVDACKGIDYSLCYPSGEFDGRSMRWDLNYFKYYFLKLLKISFNEAALENDFDRLVLYLLQAGNQYFMYRDFQARNIMLHENRPWFIDYQGGRRGPLQYDLASLLFQVKANLPYDFREEMLQWYLSNLRTYFAVDEHKFTDHYYGFVLIRLLQVMGAYGFRGYFERRAHFLQSIPYAIANIRWFLANVKLRIELPELMKTLSSIAEKEIAIPTVTTAGQLQVSVSSFSFKNGPPADYSGHGGGYVFDCRALPNPGRYDHYKALTGLDEPVIQYLERETAVSGFLKHVFKIADQHINEYQRRGFSHLQINFGCTGGQHRSVYCASRLAAYLDENYSVKLQVFHQELKA